MPAEYGQAVAQGLATSAQYHREAPMRELRLQRAQQQVAQGQLDLDKSKDLSTSETDLQLAKLSSQLRQVHSQDLKSRTFDAFSKYEADGDAKHLNQFIGEAKSNPIGANLYGDTVRIDKLTRSPEVEAQLAASGIQDIDAFFDTPELVKGFTLVTKNDGSQLVVDQSKLYKMTGYTQHRTKQETQAAMEQQVLRAAIEAPNSAETSLIKDIAEENKVSLLEAAKMYNSSKRSGRAFSGSALERLAAKFRESDPELSFEDSIRKARAITASGTKDEREARRRHQGGEFATYDEAFEAVTERTERTTSKKQVDEAAEARAELDVIAGGDFFEADLSDKKVRRKLGPHITALEKLAGASLSNEDKRIARDLRSLTALGATAGQKLSAKETGILDKLLFKTKKYINDNVSGSEGVAAYETFRNIFRNSLYGASLTVTEVQAFQDAAGTLGQKLGPVLAQLRVQLTDVKSQLQSIHDLNDPHIAHYYLGGDLDDIDDAIVALDQRLEYFELDDTADPEAEIAPAPTPGAERPPLDSFFR